MFNEKIAHYLTLKSVTENHYFDRLLIEYNKMKQDTVQPELTSKEVEEKKIDVTDDEKKAVEEKLAKLKEVKDSENIEEIKTVSEDLSKAAQAIGMKMYQQEQTKEQQGQPGADPQKAAEEELHKDAAAEDGAVEGEVVDADEEKKSDA